MAETAQLTEEQLLAQNAQVGTVQPNPLVSTSGGTYELGGNPSGDVLKLPTYDGGQVAATTVDLSSANADNIEQMINQEGSDTKAALDSNTTAAETDTTGSIEEVKAGMGDISKIVAPEGGPPAPPKFETIANDLRQQRGIDQLEGEVNTLKNDIRDAQAQARLRIQTAKREVSRMDAIAGRVSAIEEQENYRIDELNRQLAYKVDVLNSGYNAINTIMQWKQTDYANAREFYNTTFQQNLQMYQIFQDNKTQEQQTAMANLQIYMNGIQDGTLDYATMPDDLKLEIGKLEIQSGLPRGTIASLKMKAGANVITTTNGVDSVTGEGWLDIVTREADGSIKVTRTNLGKQGPTAAEQTQAEIDRMDKLNRYNESWDKNHPQGSTSTRSGRGGGGSGSGGSSKSSLTEFGKQTQEAFYKQQGDDNHVSPKDWNSFIIEWRKRGGTDAAFFSKFKSYINPNHWWDYPGVQRQKGWPERPGASKSASSSLGGGSLLSGNTITPKKEQNPIQQAWSWLTGGGK